MVVNQTIVVNETVIIINQTVGDTKLDTPIDVTVNDIKVGENATITVNIPTNATGNVTVTIDGKQYITEVINGTASVIVENLTVGPKTVVVEYPGDDNYTANYTISGFSC